MSWLFPCCYQVGVLQAYTVLSSARNHSSGGLPSVCDLFIHLFYVHLVANIVLKLFISRFAESTARNQTSILLSGQRDRQQYNKETSHDEYHTENWTQNDSGRVNVFSQAKDVRGQVGIWSQALTGRHILTTEEGDLGTARGEQSGDRVQSGKGGQIGIRLAYFRGRKRQGQKKQNGKWQELERNQCHPGAPQVLMRWQPPFPLVSTISRKPGASLAEVQFGFIFLSLGRSKIWSIKTSG